MNAALFSLLLPAAVASGTTHDASPWALDLDRFVDKLLRDQAQYFPDEATAQKSIEEYRRFLRMHQTYPEHMVAASKLVDIVWHEHIIDTKRYMADCERLFGRYLHHYPCFGKGRTFDYADDMLKAYEKTFGEYPREDVWDIFPSQEIGFPGCKAPTPAPTPPTPPTPPAPCPPPPPPVPIKLNATKGSKTELCIDHGNKLGAVLTLQVCKNTPGYDSPVADQSFDYLAGGIISSGQIYFPPGLEEGRCVELLNGNTTNGNKLLMECCKVRATPSKSYARQKFNFNSTTGQISYGDGGKSNKCIFARSETVGEPLVIWDCQDVAGQKWSGSYLVSSSLSAEGSAMQYI